MPSQKTFRGIPASPGLATGPLLWLAPENFEAVCEAGSAEQEQDRLRAAIEASIGDLGAISESSQDGDAAEMIDFQVAMLEDDTFVEAAAAILLAGGSAPEAWRKVLDEQVEDYHLADDEYFRARAIDLQDLRDRVLRHLHGVGETTVPRGAIVVADELTPSCFLEHARNIAGVALQQGSSSSHVAMLARAEGTPMLIQLQPGDLRAGSSALLDALEGELIVDPEPPVETRFHSRQAEARRANETDRVYLDRPARLPDGERVQVLINVASPQDLERVAPETCDGIGLVRTEFLFDGPVLPDEERQYRIYRRMLEWAAGSPVTFRTLDAGADKPISGLTMDREQNPFLGVRGLRLSLRRPEVFRTQLRALLRASGYGSLKIMLPMVTDPAELASARVLVAEAASELAGRGSRVSVPDLGIMVEVPACAMGVERFDAAFFSIGSNDLLQYLTACGRDSGNLEHLSRADNPALLEAIARVVEYGRRTGRPVSLCGDMAADPCHLGRLLDLGLRSVSVAPAVLAQTKALIARHGEVSAHG